MFLCSLPEAIVCVILTTKVTYESNLMNQNNKLACDDRVHLNGKGKNLFLSVHVQKSVTLL